MPILEIRVLAFTIVLCPFLSWHSLHAKRIKGWYLLRNGAFETKKRLIGQGSTSMIVRNCRWLNRFKRGYVLWRSLWRSMKLNLVSWVSCVAGHSYLDICFVTKRPNDPVVVIWGDSCSTLNPFAQSCLTWIKWTTWQCQRHRHESLWWCNTCSCPNHWEFCSKHQPFTVT